MKKILILLLLLSIVIVILIIIGKKNIHTEIIINAPVDKVWREFADFGSYPRWNPFIQKLDGTVEEGRSLVVTIKPKGGDAMNFAPVVQTYKEREILQWQGRLFIPGIFTGKHTFMMKAMGGGATKFIQREEFSGILVPFFDLGPTELGFKDMNAALKGRAEK